MDVCNCETGKEQLKNIRLSIDDIDNRLISLLNERFKQCLKIANLKKRFGLGLIDLKRQGEILDRVRELSSVEFVDVIKLVFSNIMVSSSIVQFEEMNK